MKKVYVVLLVIVALFVVTGFYYYTIRLEEKKLAEAKALQAKQEEEARRLAEEEERKRVKCEEAEKFVVVTKDRKDSVGQDILLKPKTERSGRCEYVVGADDFEIKNTDPQYFKAQVKNALLVDVGTGPSGRTLRFYDVRDKTLITEKKYFGELEISTTTLTYFGLSKTKADKKNCKEYEKLMKDFGNANLIVKKIVNLETFLVKETKEVGCVSE